MEPSKDREQQWETPEDKRRRKSRDDGARWIGLCRGRKGEGGGDGGGWFVTVDGNAHVERHVRRWRRNEGRIEGAGGGCGG